MGLIFGPASMVRFSFRVLMSMYPPLGKSEEAENLLCLICWCFQHFRRLLWWRGCADWAQLRGCIRICIESPSCGVWSPQTAEIFSRSCIENEASTLLHLDGKPSNNDLTILKNANHQAPTQRQSGGCAYTTSREKCSPRILMS